MNSLGIYISVPFCRAKCTYCNFASGVSSVKAHEQYVARVCGEIRSLRQRLGGAVIPEVVDSIYLGGGTPSVLAPVLVGELGLTLRQEFAISPDAEITLECAPGQLDDPALEAMLDFGVNRVSFGVQSLVDREAAATGRFHTREVVLRDLERVRSAGLRKLSIDLIAGMPHQTAASWQESLEVLAATGVEHASIYMLEIDEDSRLGRELLAGGSRYHAQTVPSEELTADLYESAICFWKTTVCGNMKSQTSPALGASPHNLKYWRREPYLGFGLDAHSMVRTRSGAALRFCTTAVLAEYLRGDDGSQDVRELSPARSWKKPGFWVCVCGPGSHGRIWPPSLAAIGWRTFCPSSRELCQLELLTDEEGVVRLTRRGLLFSNDVFARFLEVEEQELQMQ